MTWEDVALTLLKMEFEQNKLKAAAATDNVKEMHHVAREIETLASNLREQTETLFYADDTVTGL